ncbi:winged helix-turn-helix domain-containing protein [Psychrobium sp. 1_MG-2023]|uniref:winged helix-turn-helix domain-containing protein n=1 Tax=Psychrobium sp. 1_MG-2023 TaxID=3062624 RepID=UPI000C3463F8|nr:winged helix-turn-helix domain-containing protein [Psychrobium sp. 1_MG-2023]MDP2561317.1 winged helix-turn-helix domain-containing protein [Psychrobium sp. 1_MG-2023]PKF54132.1 hypothetical protein CW748_16880 [Alteromonadales bacterium alter-6D02]
MNFSFGPWVLISQRCLLTSPEVEKELDPLSFKLLCFFIDNQGRIIPRQELVEKVWQQSFVDDNAINRAISELRKQLSHPQFKSHIIKTHYRKGYSLTVEVSQSEQKLSTEFGATSSNSEMSEDGQEQLVESLKLAEAEKKHTENELQLNASGLNTTNHASSTTPELSVEEVSVKSKVALHRWVIVALIFVVIILAIKPFWAENDGEFKVSEKPLPTIPLAAKPVERDFSVTSATWNHGGEGNPLVSYDREFFAYSNTYQGVVKTFVKRLSDQAEVALSVPGLEVGGISWQLGQQKLLTLLVNKDRSSCDYVLFDMSTFPDIQPPKTIKSCQALTYGYAHLDEKAENLYYTRVDTGFSGSAIYQYNLKRERENVLLAPSENHYGAMQVQLSPDGKYLAYLWSQVKSSQRVYLINLETRENRLLHEMPLARPHYSLNWFDDGKHLLTAEGDQLVKLNIDTKVIEKIKLPQGLIPFYMAIEYDNQILLSQRDTQKYQLIRGSKLFSHSDITFTNAHESESSDYYPATSKSNEELHYFISKRTGSSQVWRSEKGQLTQITTVKNSVIQPISGLRLSSDNERLIFIQGGDPYLIDLNANQEYAIDELDEFEIIDIAWGNAPHLIYFINVVGDNKQLQLFNLMTRQITLVNNDGAERLYSNGAGDTFYLFDNNLHNIGTGSTIAITIPSDAFVFSDMNEHYFFGSDALSTLYRMSLSNGEVQKVKTPFRQHRFSIIDDNSILFTKRQFKNTSIKRVSWN